MIYGAGTTTADIENQDAFERRWNIAESALLGAIGLIIFASLIGLLGDGWLSKGRVSADGATLDFPRVLRRTAQARLILSVTPPSDLLSVEVAPAQAGQITATLPRALTASIGPEGTTYSFAALSGGQTKIVFELKPASAGLLRGSVSVLGRTLAVTQLVLP